MWSSFLSERVVTGETVTYQSHQQPPIDYPPPSPTTFVTQQWFESDASCPRCKIPCSPSTDAMPVFARDWTSPFMPPRSPSPLPPRRDSLSPSGQSSSLSSRQSELDDTTPAIYEKSSGSPTPTQPSDAHLLLLGRDRPSSLGIASGSKSVQKSPSTPALPPVHSDSPYTHLHPLAVSDIAAHYGSITLRVLGLLILLFALLR